MSSSVALSLLFGKKRRRRRKTAAGKKKPAGKVRRVLKGYCVKKTKSSGYRIVKVYVKKRGKSIVKKAHYANGRSCKRRCYKRMSLARKKLNSLKKKKSAFGRRTKRKTVSRRRRSSFGSGVGGSYMPSSMFMSPYPSSVDAGAPWAR